MASGGAPAASHAWLVRWRVPLFLALTLHFVLLHYFVLGFVSWDGPGHRVPPVVELAQHGALNNWKSTNWALEEFRPFLELVNLPFLLLFGQDGLYFAFATTLFPLCVWAIYAFARELTHDDVAAFYTTVTYILLPFINAQLFSGHIDWAMPAITGFWVHALLLIAKADTPSRRDYLRFLAASFVFTSSRQQAPYLAVAMFGLLAACLFVERAGGSALRVRLRGSRVVAVSFLVLLVGMAPAVIAQIGVFLRWGSPIYPYRFELFGLKMGEGQSMEALFALGGLPEYSAKGFLLATWRSYFWPERLPYLFFDGRVLGDSVYVPLALVTLPLTVRRMDRRMRVVLGVLILLSVAARDFWQVRYASSVVFAACVCNGVLVAYLAAHTRLAALYFVSLAVFAVHILRPEYESWRIAEGDPYPRMNASMSSAFQHGAYDAPMFPDMHAKILLAFAPNNQFSLPLYGRKLTNQIVASTPRDLGPRCEEIHKYTDAAPSILVVDDYDLTKGCERRCVVIDRYRCWAWSFTAP